MVAKAEQDQGAPSDVHGGLPNAKRPEWVQATTPKQGDTPTPSGSDVPFQGGLPVAKITTPTA